MRSFCTTAYGYLLTSEKKTYDSSRNGYDIGEALIDMNTHSLQEEWIVECYQ
jgi:hypothetical protein